MKALLYSGMATALSAALIAGAQADAGAQVMRTEVKLAAVTEALPATVLTLEGGLVGIQHLIHFTPMQLQGSLCTSPNTCQPVDYPAWPLGEFFNNKGADQLIAAVNALPETTPVIPFGHSQGGQVIYAAVRRWTADPSTAPDPSRLSWVSIGNPENAFGGFKRQDGLAPDTPYQGTEVIKQYDGWADWPTGPFNLLSVLNAIVGMNTTHVTGYFDVDLNSPDNILYTPDTAEGTPGNITYVFVPNDTLPLIKMTGLLAPLLNPILDPILRPIIESGYNRPIGPVGAAVSPPLTQVLSATAAAPARVSVKPTVRAAASTTRQAPSVNKNVRPRASSVSAANDLAGVSPQEAKRQWGHSSHIVRH